MQYLARAVWVVIAILVALGCATTPIQRVYQDELQQMSPGMTVADFRKVMPKAYVVGQNTIGGKRVDAYEVRSAGETSYSPQQLWFYFFNERLIKWGEPGAWPEPADLIVEWRNR